MHGGFEEDEGVRQTATFAGPRPKRDRPPGHGGPALRAAKILGVSLPRLAGMVGCKPESLGMFPLGPRAQRRLRQIERIIQILRPIFLSAAGFRSWLRQRREVFGGKSPLDFLDARKTQLVMDIAEDILIGNPI